MSKIRLDLLLVERGLTESRAKAQAVIMAGQVRVDGQLVGKPATLVDAGSQLHVETGPRFVSRGGEKLAAALEVFQLELTGRVCADVGASTGGFTDCLLQQGAARVYAIDVGKGILHWKLRTDRRVIVLEETNARHVKSLPETVSLVTIDASFISLKILIPVVKAWLSPASGKVPGGEVIALIKPQFEAGRRQSARNKGVIRDPEVHRQVLTDLLTFAQELGFGVQGLIRSPLLGPKGNLEFLVWISLGDPLNVDVAGLVESVL
ncbi:MAG: TlyA family RNA methyltransferase [Chloroflexota bacterium]